VTHRRAGKTVACVEDLQRAAMWCAKVRPRFAYISPFLKQSKAVAWDYLRAATGPLRRHGARVHESELRVDYAIERCASKCYAKNIRSWVIYITVRSRASL